MTRSFDTIPDEADRSAEFSKPSAPVMSVCPFCGAISEKSEAPCPRCKMENSALTRQATRARVGPWYVMQSRNPSAPGMKCNTLLALIRKGQITPRSVIRGPTTFQLWRFAARVKGISKEFGLCYSCGAEVQRTSTFCPRCSRSQELPPNPDVLLENEPQASKTVYRQVDPRPESPEPVGPLSSAPPSSATRPPMPDESETSPPARPTSQIPSAAETMAGLAELPSPHNAPRELQSRPMQRPQEGVLTPRELAAAFSLQYDPTMDTSASLSRPRRGRGIAFAVLLLLLIGGGASLFYFSPALRQRFVAWVQDSAPPAAVSQQNALPVQQSTSDRTPDWMMSVPTDKPVSGPSKSVANPSPSLGANASNPAPSSGAVNSSSENGTGSPSSPPPQRVDQSASPAPSTPQLSAPPQPVQQTPSAQPPSSIPPSPSVQPQSTIVASAAPAADAPITTATPNDPRTNESSTSQAAANASKLRQSAGNNLDELAMELRGNGMDAEHRQDYAAAEYYYQQVELLPRDHWPIDIQALLKNVQRQLGAGAGR